MDEKTVATILLLAVLLLVYGVIKLVTHIVRRVIRLKNGGEPETRLDYLLVLLFLSSAL